ncbi:MAG: EamA family transporter [Candidatus Paceibacterota bacterium]|jgi:transporter family protein
MSWIILALLSAFFAALVAILGKLGLGGVDTTLATTIRAIVMACALLIFAISFGKFDLGKIDGKSFIFIILSGLVGALSWLFYFAALKIGPASGAAALDRLSVVFILILAILFLGETLTWKTGLGALLITSGAILFAI